MGTSLNHTVGPSEGYKHTHTIIFLHGRDSSPLEFAEELFESETSGPADQPRSLRALLPTVKWVFPAAPILPSTRFGVDMSQWFDMWSVEDHAEEGAEQRQRQQQEAEQQQQQQVPHESGIGALRASAAAILDVVREEERCVSPGRIFLAGISQGFAVVAAAFLADDGLRARLAGLVGLCSWMPRDLRMAAEGGQEELLTSSSMVRRDGTDVPNVPLSSTAARPTPVLLCHSSDDDIVAITHGRRLRDILTRLPRYVEVEWHEYGDGGHWINEPRGVDDMVDFLKRHM